MRHLQSHQRQQIKAMLLASQRSQIYQRLVNEAKLRRLLP
jgi:Spy/CpxP family protein refolding chaperone